MEETTVLQIYIADFGIFYTNLRHAFWPILIHGILGFIVFGLFRIVWKYATASIIGKWDRGSYVIRGTERIIYKYFESPKEQEKYNWYDENHKYTGIKGGHLYGTAFDIATISITSVVLIWTWPLIIVIFILFGPVQLCRNHFMKKKVFIANLKGKKVDL